MSDERRRVAEMLVGSGPSQFEGLGLSPEVQARLDERAARTMGILSFALGGAGRIGQAAATGMNMARRPQKDWVQELTQARSENPYGLPPASADTRLADEARGLVREGFFDSVPGRGDLSYHIPRNADRLTRILTDENRVSNGNLVVLGGEGIGEIKHSADNPPIYPPPQPEFGPSTADRMNSAAALGTAAAGLTGIYTKNKMLSGFWGGAGAGYGALRPIDRTHSGQYNPQMPYFPTDGDR